MTTDKICGTLGCRNDASHRIRHPEHGKLVVCHEHARPFEVLGMVHE